MNVNAAQVHFAKQNQKNELDKQKTSQTVNITRQSGQSLFNGGTILTYRWSSCNGVLFLSNLTLLIVFPQAPLLPFQKQHQSFRLITFPHLYRKLLIYIFPITTPLMNSDSFISIILLMKKMLKIYIFNQFHYYGSFSEKRV